MIKSLLIGKLLFELLSTDEGLHARVHDRIFPQIAKNDARFPFIVFTRDSVLPKYCKDGNMEDDVTVSVKIYSSNYDEGCEIAQMVRDRIDLKKGQDDTFVVNQIHMTSASESWIEDTFVQTLTFTMRVG